MANTHTNTLTVCRASAGTGKTYTLAANYVALLLSKQSYRSILAVTFTNKATQEMKDRILLFLDNIANNTGADANAALQAVRARMISNTNATDEELREEAARCYKNMLEDYDNIHISTIDTFLMQLLNGLGQMLDDASASAEVELDVEHLITMAVDNLLTRPMVQQTALYKQIANYVSERLDEGKDWDIRGQLIDIAKRLYNESVQQLDAEGEIVFDAEAIHKYKVNCDWRHAECLKRLQEALNRVQGTSYGKFGKNIDKFIDEVGTYLDGTCRNDYLFRGATPALRKKLHEDPSLRELADLDDLCVECQRVYNTYKSTIALLNDLAMMSALRGEIQALLAEQNSVLLAQTADKLHRAMAVGDADFILEKAGIRYKHIMLDEFQDTSVLQWENFKPLVEEILANGGTVFIVGDIKQSIYRWRNGNWQIMAGLNDETPNIGAYFHDMPLRRNFRSSQEVVQFNLGLFQKLTAEGYGNEFAAALYDEEYGKHPLTDYYKPGNSGGYVQMKLVPYSGRSNKPARETIMSDMFAEIESRLQQGESASDMLILVRGHKDAEQVVSYYRSLHEQSAVFAQTQIVSYDSFHLDASLSVQFVIQTLRWRVLQDDVAKWYIRLVFPAADLAALEQLNVAVSLCELAEEIIKILPSRDEKDLAYINALLDGVHDYVSKYGSNIAAFLTYWEDKMHEQSIAAPAADAIRIMTIHTAKGLEAKNVFIPFCSWNMEIDRQDDVLWCQAKGLLKAPVQKLKRIPVRMSSALANSEYEAEYRQEHLQQRLDNLNMLYVALTRARDTLYIYGDMQQTKEGLSDTAASLLYKAFAGQWAEQEETFFLSFGETQPAKQTNSSKSGGMIDRFAFDGAAVEQAELHVGERPVSFRMSRESIDSLRFGADSDERAGRIDLGNVCHAIMENMETKADRDAAINDARMCGLIADEDAEREIVRLIDAAWTNIQMLDWFSGRWELLCEATFLTANAELRPDRVMIDRETSTAIVLDYKFGQREAKYAQQVRNYMRIMAELGFRHVEGYLWYAQEAVLQPVTL